MFKKIIILIIALIMLTTPALAADQTQQIDVFDQNKKIIKSIVFCIGVNQYFVNGQTSGVKMDAAPFIDSDRTFVPVRFLGNALGITNDKITWDDSQGRAALQAGSTRAELTIGKKQIVTNGQVKDIDVAPQLKPPGRTFLPARFVCEALGYEVDWQDDRFVVVWPKGEPKPDIEQLKKRIEQMVNTNSPFTTISKNTGAVIENGLLVFYEKSNASSQEAFFIQKSNKYDYLMSISSYSDDSLNAVKEALKVYYPTEYNTAFEKLKSTINSGSEVKSIYYDNRYFGAKKFTDGTVIYIGSEGVKY